MLPTNVPVNEDVYIPEVGENTWHRFRVTDILVSENADQFELFAAYHFWKPGEDCGVMRISSMAGDTDDFISGSKPLEWRTVFETAPCLKATHGHLTCGDESGGRMGFVDNRTSFFR